MSIVYEHVCICSYHFKSIYIPLVVVIGEFFIVIIVIGTVVAIYNCI